MFEHDAERSAKRAQALYRSSGAGLGFAISILLFVGVGYWLDRKFGTSPWLLLVGLFTGFPLALYSLVKKLGPSDRAE